MYVKKILLEVARHEMGPYVKYIIFDNEAIDNFRLR